ncbi:response regulator [Aggregatilinea lenta]|uniref:response regulator n=1 Tax=Aggregatilinea lenta TaxID=913108 RepID=UPI000E5C1193|nr:response regulator [Aggregatilinea lenta]
MAIRVLIIDPDIPFLVRIKQALDDSNRFNVSISANGLAAEDALHHHLHDIAVLDFSVPDMDTAAIVTQLRHIQPNLAVIVTPASEDQIEYAGDLNVQGVLAKPYAARDLMALIQQIIPVDPRRAAYEEEEEEEPPDVFEPPEMPPSLRHLMEPAASDQRSPTELLDRVERTHLPDADAAPPVEQDWSAPADAAGDAGEWPSEQAWSEHAWDDANASGTHILTPETPDEAWAGANPTAEAAPSGTRMLDEQMPDPSATEILAGDDELDPTMRLAETETLDDLILKHGWLSPADRARVEFALEPPVDPEDTPTVPNQDLDSIRQFLATDHQGHISTEFGEVLDAVAQTPPNEASRSTTDREFHDLVESLRMTEEQNAAQTPLDALLSAMAAEQAARGSDESDATSSTLDYLLHTLHSDETPGSAERPAAPHGTGTETIGEVMSGLFDPTFEGVLAALAGKEIEDDEALDQPPDEDWLNSGDISLDDLRAQAQATSFEDLSGDDDPVWLADYRPEDGQPAKARPGASSILENASTDEDSASYPATQALNAVSASDSSEFSLDALLSEIERYMPQSETPRPRLKPLPSWSQADTGQESEFDLSLVEPEGAGEFVPPPSDEMLRFEPGPSPDTQPSRAIVDEWDRAAETPDLPDVEAITPPPYIAPPESAAFEAPAFYDFEPAELPEAEPDFDSFFAEEALTPDEIAPSDEVAAASHQAAAPDEPDETDAAFEAFFAAELETSAQAEPSQAGRASDEDLAGIFEGLLEDAASAVQSDAPVDVLSAEDVDLGDIELPAFEQALADEGEWAWDEVAEVAEASDAEWTPQDAAAVLQEAEELEPRDLERAEIVGIAPDDETFAPWSGESYAAGPEDEDVRLAHAAVELTRFALESSAQAVLLTRSGERLAEAGDMPVAAMDSLYEIVTSAWQTSSATSPSLMRYIGLPDMGQFMLYSTVVEDDLILSMIFHAGMSIHATRRLAQRISTSLASVPDTAPARPAARATPPAPEPVAEPDQPASADELREAAEVALEQAATGKAASAPAPAEAQDAPRDAPADEPSIAYTGFWLTADPSHVTLGGDLAQDLRNWIGIVAQENGWDVPTLEIGSDSVVLTLSIPQKTLPDAAITVLMQETAGAAAEYYPELATASDRLWADGYYLITPPRELTDREMARFAAYQYQQ